MAIFSTNYKLWFLLIFKTPQNFTTYHKSYSLIIPNYLFIFSAGIKFILEYSFNIYTLLVVFLYLFFSLCLRDRDFDSGDKLEIDYSPYLKFHQR